VISSVVPLLLLSGCGNNSGGNTSNFPATHTVDYRIELWGANFEKTKNNHCMGTDSNYLNNKSVNLVGPDGIQLSSATFSFGNLQRTGEPKDLVNNFPNGDICAFSVTFPDVPEVATYRIQTADAAISSVTFSLSQMKLENWSMVELLGADSKQ